MSGCGGVQCTSTCPPFTRPAETTTCSSYHLSCIYLGNMNRTQKICGRGFLWGTLADGLAQSSTVNPAGGADVKRGTSMAPRSVVAGAAVVQMPSLSGTSDLSSGVISGLRRALLWAEEGGGVPCAGSLISRYGRRKYGL